MHLNNYRIIDPGKSSNPVSKICQLCTKEKHYLIYCYPNSPPLQTTKRLANNPENQPTKHKSSPRNYRWVH